VFCPTCKSEYRPGIIKCADCGIDLVDHLGESEMPENVDISTPEFDFVELLQTFNEADVVFVKSLLQGEGIQYYHEGEYRGSTRRGNHPMRLFVADYQLEQARELLRDFEGKFWVFTPPSTK